MQIKCFDFPFFPFFFPLIFNGLRDLWASLLAHNKVRSWMRDSRVHSIFIFDCVKIIF